MRIITYVETEVVEKQEDTDVYLLSIYDKSVRINISDQLIEQIIAEIRSEIDRDESGDLGQKNDEE